MVMESDLFLQANQQKDIIAIGGSVEILINTIVTIMLIRLNCSIIAIKIVNTLIYVLRAIFYKIYVRRKYEINITKNTKSF